MELSAAQLNQILAAYAGVVKILETHFPNLSVDQSTAISHEIVKTVVVELSRG